MSLPMIDIAGFLEPSSTPEALQTIADKIHAACLTTGFFYLSGHGVTAEEGEQILRSTRAFLVDGTPGEKERLSIATNDHARGYQRIGDNVTGGKSDWHEALDLYAPSPFPHLPQLEQLKVLAGQNRFPARPADFQPVVENWIRRLSELGLVLMRATAMGLKMSLSETEQLLDQVRNSFWVLRCIGYPPLPSTHDGVSCGAHKDYGCFTFLHADSTKGSLQVYVPKAKATHDEQEPEYHWIEANPIEGAFVVNIGEMWETWTNGLYKATLHRVVHKSNNYRVSVPFFYEPAFDAIVAPLPAAIRLQQRLQGKQLVEIVKKPVQYGEFLISKVSRNFSTSADSDAQRRDRY
ncbi:hypothetical protein PGT21_007627 [Puccinia graminis f. sp. tritici]|uniref:Fe2OG dioxygenase domain-containing protein n=2 Tax=Puccinia graminis f. sp. tritici TaxID=56615 RepID=E3KG87_PUCGT|nr:uncharacterized protein PGTG_09135 [Puccinia graminis f. sp. tritici CRL 75-36-700-3]EFP83182.1 hypothetical protein PGTG_09135 [Puccinia graminis f. sp. tritici CRL 75-36-700-3]KAA1089122.1 hypothetical protein PGT21_007627 [Puccinia graminis f. sp. tritici]